MLRSIHSIDVAQSLDHCEVDQRGPQVSLEIEAARIGPPCLAHQVVDRDDRDDRRSLDHEDDLVAIGTERDDQSLRQDDLPQRLQLGKAKR